LTAVDTSWKVEDTTAEDPTWGANEEEYWESRESKAKEAKRVNKIPEQRVPKPGPSENGQYEPRCPTIIDHQPLSVDIIDHIEKVILRQRKPYPVTVTAKNPRDEPSEENKRKWFNNLRRQLCDEVHKAKMLQIDNLLGENWYQAQDYADRDEYDFDIQEIDMIEPTIRKLVKLLITTRQNVVRYGELAVAREASLLD
jgi:hypothetical protein